MFSDEVVQHAIKKIAIGVNRSQNIDKKDASKVMALALQGKIDTVQLAIFFIALRMKGESSLELEGMLDALQDSVVSEQIDDDVVYLVDPFDGYCRYVPITPFLAAVLASAKVRVVVPGVAQCAPKYGVTSEKILRAHGLNFTQSAKIQLQQRQWCYVSQRHYANELYQLSDVRKRMIKRTALTVLERILMPVKAKKTHMVIGYVHKPYAKLYTHLAQYAGFDNVLALKGLEGGVMPALYKPLQYQLSSTTRKEITVPIVPKAPRAIKLIDSSAEQVLALGLSVLQGEKNVLRDYLVHSAAIVLLAMNKQRGFTCAVKRVENLLDSGKVLTYFNA